ALFANMILLGHAWQRAGVPVSADAIQQAIRLNGVAVEGNLHAFQLGRASAWQAERLRQLMMLEPEYRPEHDTLAQVLERNASFLAKYQNAAYARRYRQAIDRIHSAEQRVKPDSDTLTMAAARSLFHLMAIKDEYEVARLYTDGEFRRQLEAQFEGDYTLRFHLAPPLFAAKDHDTGRPRKVTLGPYTEQLMRVLAHGRRLRGTWLDVFGMQHERRVEKQLLRDFEQMLLDISARLNLQNYETDLQLIALPRMVRGFGPVKMASIERYQSQLAKLSQRNILETAEDKYRPPQR